MNNYRYDSDLEFLGRCSNEELESLYDVLVYDSNYNKWMTEELSTSSERVIYEKNYSKYWRTIAAELQYAGGNTIANMYRGHGVLYTEILDDVLDNLKISNYGSIEEREERLILHFFKIMLDKLSFEERKQFLKKIGLKNFTKENLSTGEIILGLQTILRMGGFSTYKYMLILTNLIIKFVFGRGLTLAGNVLLTRIMSFALGPIGLLIGTSWTIIDIASPAFRITTPTCVVIAALRIQDKMRRENSNLVEDFAKFGLELIKE